MNTFSWKKYIVELSGGSNRELTASDITNLTNFSKGDFYDKIKYEEEKEKASELEAQL